MYGGVLVHTQDANPPTDIASYPALIHRSVGEHFFVPKPRLIWRLPSHPLVNPSDWLRLHLAFYVFPSSLKTTDATKNQKNHGVCQWVELVKMSTLMVDVRVPWAQLQELGERL